MQAYPKFKNRTLTSQDSLSKALQYYDEASKLFKKVNSIYLLSDCNLNDGDTVSSPVKVEFLVYGKTIKPAGTDEEGTGHHHIIIDGGSIQAGKEVPVDDTHIHFGKCQTETTLDLSPGEHTLTLQFADFLHHSFGGKWSKTITVTVE